MEPDKYQQAWQAQSSQTKVTVDPDQLLKEVQRKQQEFKATIFLRDLVEIGVALVMLPLWIYLGVTISLPWTWYLTIPALIWMPGFILVDRRRHKRIPTEPGEPLLTSAKESLSQVSHQIWLLRNVFWWYLLPFALPIMAFFAQVTWRVSKTWMEAFGGGGFLFAFLFAFSAFLDYVNQRAVRVQLEPQRRELLALLNSLGDETTSEGAMKTEMSIKNSSVFKRWILLAVASVVAFACIALTVKLFDSKYDGPPQSSGPAGDSLAGLISDLRKEKKLVGLAAMVMVDGQVVSSAVDGERKLGSGVQLKIDDRWHLGSITKSITATMIGRLVESGKMQWSSTIGESFPDASIHADWKPVTLRQLLTHTAGAPANFSFLTALEHPPLGPECTQARRTAMLKLIATKPAYPPGKKFAYSNVGYTIAGALAEKVTGVTWDDLVKREVFEPLELTSAGFGPPKSSDKHLEQPRGHLVRLGWKISMNDAADNTPIIGPAGIVHMTLGDMCTYATEHLRGERAAGNLLSGETYKVLHTPELNRYACGWVKKEPNADVPFTVYWHNGSNTMWYALVVFIPEKNMVIAVTSNDGDITSVEAAAWEVVKVSVK